MIQAVNNNFQPTFGMALVKPATPEATKAFAEYVKINSFCVNRGLKRFIKAQQGNRFDIVHDAENNAVKVLSPDGFVKKSIFIKEKTEETATNTNMFITLAKGLWRAVTKPECWLPKELKQAGRYATKYEKEVVANEKAIAEAKKLEEKAIINTEKIFDSVK